DDQASDAQQAAMLAVFTGQLGGAIADLAALVGEVVGVERAPVSFEVSGGKGHVKLGSFAEAELEPFQGHTGMTSLHDSVFSTIPGSPAYVAKALTYTRNTSRFGLRDVDLNNHNAV